MDINDKIIKLLIASGNVSQEKVDQARRLAISLLWDGEIRPTKRAPDARKSAPKIVKSKSKGSVKPARVMPAVGRLRPGA